MGLRWNCGLRRRRQTTNRWRWPDSHVSIRRRAHGEWHAHPAHTTHTSPHLHYLMHLHRGRSIGFLPPYARTRELRHFFPSIFLFGQSDVQVSKTIFDSWEILFLELLLLCWSSCYFVGAPATFWSSCWVLAYGGGSSVSRPLPPTTNGNDGLHTRRIMVRWKDASVLHLISDIEAP